MAKWKAIAGSDYVVSDDGQVRRCKGWVTQKNGRQRCLPDRTITVAVWGNSRYRRCTLWIDGQQRTIYVHQLVATAFLGPCPPGYEVNHKDCNRENNHVSNLEYVTSGENKRHHWLLRRGLYSGERSRFAKLKELDVRLIKLATDHGFPQSYLAKLFDVRQATIEKIHLNQRWKHLLAPATNGG